MLHTLTNSITGNVSTTLQATLFIVCAIAAANMGLTLFTRLGNAWVPGETNTLTGIFFGAVSVLYSLILAFVLLAEWDDYNGLKEVVASESDKLNSIVAHSSNLPDTIKTTIGNALSAYCKQVITQEWTQHISKATDQPSAIPVLRHLLLITYPADKLQENMLKVIDDDLSAISDLRRDRLSHTHSQLPQLVWGVLAAGAVMLVVLCYFFIVSSIKLHRVYLSFFVCLLAMCLALVYILDRPFTSGSAIDNSPYKRVLNELPAYYASGKKQRI